MRVLAVALVRTTDTDVSGRRRWRGKCKRFVYKRRVAAPTRYDTRAKDTANRYTTDKNPTLFTATTNSNVAKSDTPFNLIRCKLIMGEWWVGRISAAICAASAAAGSDRGTQLLADPLSRPFCFRATKPNVRMCRYPVPALREQELHRAPGDVPGSTTAPAACGPPSNNSSSSPFDTGRLYRMLHCADRCIGVNSEALCSVCRDVNKPSASASSAYRSACSGRAARGGGGGGGGGGGDAALLLIAVFTPNLSRVQSRCSVCICSVTVTMILRFCEGAARPKQIKRRRPPAPARPPPPPHRATPPARR
ncbi:unnamed protein product [Diatraea saccharalis]|uniref:Uncharacterized protein n=1 Tax=Diatraea saccharalis TaxID=40085 RepID=A0A9N9W618_9NEOP|nr:unnamed protein product [Diatraea saccharalis]